MNITQDQAICMLFYKECNQENAKKCREEIDNLGPHGFQVCYKEDPSKPILVSKLRILGDPISVHTYPEALGKDKVVVKRDTDEASTLTDSVVPERNEEDQVEPNVNVVDDDNSAFEDARMRIFINKVFLAKSPGNEQLYYGARLRLKDIFTAVKKYTIFNDKSLFAFHNWCAQQNLQFLKAERVKDSYINETVFIVYELKMEYFDEALEMATKEAAAKKGSKV